MRKFYSLVLIAAGLLIGTNAWAGGDMNDDHSNAKARIGTEYYSSVAGAIADVPKNDVQTTVLIIGDEVVVDENSSGKDYTYATIAAKQDIVLNLNGCTLSITTNSSKTSNLFTIYGRLTIKDESVEGDGLLTYKCTHQHPSGSCSTINNHGTLIVESGRIENMTPKDYILSAGYTIDNVTNGSLFPFVVCTIQGGYIYSESECFRNFANSENCPITLNLVGGEAYGKYGIVFMQDPSGSKSGSQTVNITGGTYTSDDLPLVRIYTTGNENLKNTNLNITGADVVCNKNAVVIQHTETDPNATAEDVLKMVQQLEQQYPNVFNITAGTFDNGEFDGKYTVKAGYVNTSTWSFDPVQIVEHPFPTIHDNKVQEIGNDDGSFTLTVAQNIEVNGVADIDNLDKDKACDIKESITINKNDTVEVYNMVIGTATEPAVVTVKKGTTLAIGEGGLQIKNGSQIIVEAGAILKVGSNGISGETPDAVIVYSDETGSGVVAISPQAFLHQSPELKVIMKTRGYRTATGSKFQFFAVPTKEAADLHWPITLNSWFYEFDPMIDDASNWSLMASTTDMVPFKGYIMTNNSTSPWQEYTMEGAVNGRDNANMVLKGNASKTDNWNLLGNSYLAPIDAATLLKGVQVTGDAGIELSIAIYDAAVGGSNNYKQASKASLDEGNADFSVIPPMNAFFMNLQNMDEAGFTIDYANCVWNQEINTQAMYAPKRSTAKAQNIKLSVAADGMNDRVILRESDNFTSAFDNGYEVTKMMNDEMNLYVNAESPMAELATNDLDGTQLNFQAGNAVEYTMTFSNGLNDNFVLVDNANGARIAMTDGATYTFVATPNETTENRFEIRKAGGVVTDLAEMKAAHAVKGIYTAAGQYVGKADRWNTLPAGMYIVDGVKMAK